MPMPYQLKNMYNEGQYEDILELAKIPEELQAFCEWDYFYYMNAAYKLQRYEECLNIYRDCKKRFPEFDKLNDKCGWSLYHVHIKNFNRDTDDRSQYKKQLLFIISNCDYSEYSPFMRALKQLLRDYKNGVFGNKIDYKTINSCLDMVNVAVLPDKENMLDVDGKKRRLASDREFWYFNKIKALKELDKNEECIDMVAKAMLHVHNFHNNSDMWMLYYAASALFILGKSAEAKQKLEEILSSGFEHFSVWELMYKIHRLEGKHQDAMRCGAMCSLSDKNHKMRVNFYNEFAEYLYEQGELEAAMLHRQLSVNLREENGWNAKPLLVEWTVDEKIAELRTVELLKRLQVFWREKRDAGMERISGKVKKMLEHGQGGFITGNDGNDYYFQVRDIENRYRSLEGAAVSFVIVEKLDKKKNIMKKNAVRIIVG